ncbi:hypothetical protein EON80_05110 [bacterium]|nr:MAG: hypothetical protein EON80_05110 [bacterium]
MPAKDGKNPPSRKFDEPLSSDIYKDEKPSPFSIEGIRSGAVQSKVFKGFILLSGLVMAGGLIISGLNPTGQVGRQPGGSAPSSGPVATVGNQSVTGIQLANSFEQQQRFNEQFGQKTGVTDYLRARQQTLQGLTDNASNVIAAEAAGIQITDAEIDAKLAELIKERLKPEQGQTEAAFLRAIQTSRFKTLDNYKAELEKNYDRQAISNSLAVEKLEKRIKDENKVTEDDYKRSITKLKLWQIVLRPKFPAPGAKDVKAETEKNAAEAESRATKLFAELKAKPTLANFKTTAQKSSEDIATKAKGGDFGWKAPGDIFYSPEIGAALSKAAGPLAGPYKDPSGSQYIFYIEGRKPEFPKDFAKNKKKLLTDYETQEDNKVWQEKQAEYKKAQTPQISDPALAAYQLQTVELLTKTGDEQKQVREEAVSRYEEALNRAGEKEAAAIHYQLSQLYRDLNERQKQQDALSEAIKEVSTDPSLRLEYARALRESGKPKDALAQVKAASTALDADPGSPSPFGGFNPADQVRQQIAAEFESLKDPKAAATERAKIKPAPQGGMGGMGGMSPNIQVQPG